MEVQRKKGKLKYMQTKEKKEKGKEGEGGTETNAGGLIGIEERRV